MQAQTYMEINIQQLQERPTLQTRHIDGPQLWGDSGLQTLLTYEQNCKATLDAQYKNGFYSAFLYAYQNHGDVKLTPDDVWIVIMLYFSKYVNDNAKHLRNAFVSHKGKKQLVVKTQNYLSQSQWDEFFTLMIEEVKKNTTKGVTEKFQCDFTTTTRFQKLVSTALIMDTYQEYFQYRRKVGCGIQNVHLGGTLADWKKIYQKTQALEEYDVDGELKEYVGKVSEILKQFIETYQGKVDVDFWNRVMNKQKGKRGSGTTTLISGWIVHLFGYFEPTETVQIQNIGFNIKIDNLLTQEKKTVRFVGGFKAVSSEGHVYRPHLSFAIHDEPKTKPKQQKSKKYFRHQ